ncbi:GEVED domain-containing protein [Chitinophagaceae bacterium MMS25-I14]
MSKSYSTIVKRMVLSGTVCSLLLGSSNVYAQYCTPAYTNGCSSGDRIENLKLIGDSGSTLSDAGGTCVTGGPYYTDKTTMNVNLHAGGGYTLSLNTAAVSGYDNAKVWIDFNHNNTFDDPSELVGVSTQVQNSTSVISVSIPSTALQGTYRMRVRLNYDPAIASLTPCGLTNLGEARDYKVTLSLDPLPVTIINFSGRKNGSYNDLFWSMGETETLQAMYLERSADGDIFEEIANVAITGKADYTYSDMKPLTGNNFYRLAMKEKNGKVSYSNAILIYCKQENGQMSIYPNPNHGQFHLKFLSDKNEAVTVSVTDMSGRLISSEQRSSVRGANDIVINSQNLIPGSYMLHVQNATANQYLPLLVQ